MKKSVFKILINKIVMDEIKRTRKKRADVPIKQPQPQLNKQIEAIQTQSPYFSPKKTRNYIKLAYEKTKDEKPNLKSLQAALKVPAKRTKKPVKIEHDPVPGKSQSLNADPTKDLAVDQKFNIKTELGLDQIKQEPAVEDIEGDPKFVPLNWQQTWENILQMRATGVAAPVDTMGCDKCSDDDYDEKTQRYHTLVSLMLSSQTKDQVTHAAVKKLREHGLTPENIVKMDVQTLETLIYPASFYKQKAKHIQKTAQILIDQYESDIPRTIKELLKLPGVGPKMAHICMACAWKEISGIGVDTHVHRIANWLNWVPKPTKNPEETRKELEKWLPFELWGEINHLLVGFGQTICNPMKPKCGECSNIGICPAAYKYGSALNRKRK